jgi:hypothetical protein
MDTHDEGRMGMTNGTGRYDRDPAQAGEQPAPERPVFLVNFGLSWRQILAGATVVAGLLGGAGVTGWLVLPSDLRKVEGDVEGLKTSLQGLKTQIKDMDDTQGQVIDVLVEVRNAVSRLVSAAAPPVTPEPPPDLLRPELPGRRFGQRPRGERLR